jgi:hypothetical protein
MVPNNLNDFIVVGEFSEVEGPISRLLITVDDSEKIVLDSGEVFNLEAFVLRVMSVELNTNNDDWCSVIELNGELTSHQPLTAFVQHINLLDLNARGYVRSIIIAYITPENDKLMNNFPLFSSRMNKISETLKEINHKIFSTDLQMRLADLLLTELHSKNTSGYSDISYSHTAQSLRENIDDLCHLHARIPAHSEVKILFPHNHKLNLARNNILDTVNKDNIDITDLNIYSPKIILSLQQNSSIYSKKLRSVTDLCGKNWDTAVELLRVMLAELNKPDIVLYFELEDIDYSHCETSLIIGNMSFLNFNFHKADLHETTNVEREEVEEPQSSQAKSRSVDVVSLERNPLQNQLILEMGMSQQSGFSGSLAQSKPKDIPKQLLVDPGIDGLYQGSSYHSQGEPFHTTDSYHSQEMPSAIEDKLNKKRFSEHDPDMSFVFPIEETSPNTLKTDLGKSETTTPTGTHSPAVYRNYCPADVKEKTENLNISDISSAVELSQLQFRSYPDSLNTDSSCDSVKARAPGQISLATRDKEKEKELASLNMTLLTMQRIEKEKEKADVLYHERQRQEIEKESSAKLEGKEGIKMNEGIKGNETPKQTNKEPKILPFLMHSKINNFSTILAFNSFHTEDYGFGLLKFIRQNNSWTPHLIFSLLKGRTVIIKGYIQDVVSLVQALGIFVASSLTSTSPNIAQWYEEPLSFAVLGNLKLIGISKEKTIPLVLQKYTTILDLDKKTLLSPAYKDGYYIHEILKKESFLTWSDDATYIAYVHSILYEIAMKSCQCYHNCWIGTGNLEHQNFSQRDLGADVNNKSPVKIPKARSLENIDLEKVKENVSKVHSSVSDFNFIKKTKLSQREEPPNIHNTWSNFSLQDVKSSADKHKETQRQKQKQMRKQFFEKYHIAEGDREIIQYFCKVIIAQQNELEAYNKPNQASLGGIPPTIYLDYSLGVLYNDDPLNISQGIYRNK